MAKTKSGLNRVKSYFICISPMLTRGNIQELEGRTKKNHSEHASLNEITPRCTKVHIV